MHVFLVPYQVSWQRAQLYRALKSQVSSVPDDKGFALPLAMGMGFVMLILGLSTILLAQDDRTTAQQRTESSLNLAATEGGMARTLAQLTAPNNAVLLNRNYDTINPDTGTTYLGADGIPNSGDEQTTAVDEWTDYDLSTTSCYQQKALAAPNFALSGTVGTNTYNLRAYRYNPQQQQGTLLIESSSNGRSSMVLMTIAVQPDYEGFPGIVATEPNDTHVGVVGLRGRHLLGSNANVYYRPQSSTDPSLTGISRPGDATRSNYLNAIYSSAIDDGAGSDTVGGTIFACPLGPKLPAGVVGTNLGIINTSQTLRGVGGDTPTLFSVEKINLDDNEVLTVDTTGGPVKLDIVNKSGDYIILRDTAKILNVRTDGQPPRVGDLRIIDRENIGMIMLYDQTCIQGAFIWSLLEELSLLTSGPGCPGGRNTNIEGVVWVEAILSAKNHADNRDINYPLSHNQLFNSTVTPGATSGIAVPDDVSSLSDLFKYTGWPARYRFGGVKNWQRLQQ